MTLETIYYIGQTVAVIAILISLIFVGIQMRDSNRLARAQMHQEISDSFTNLVMTLPREHDRFYEAWFSPEAYKKLDRSESETMNGTMLALWKHFENVYYQHKNGFVDGEYFQSTSRFVSIFIWREGVRFWWEGRKAVFAPEFVSFVETLEQPDMPLDMKTMAHSGAADITASSDTAPRPEEPNA